MPNPYAQPAYVKPKSRLVAGLLGIFLGWLGIHRFYLGYPGVGVAQIIVSVLTFTTVGWLWGFIEGVMILAGARTFQTDAFGVPLTD